MCCGTVASNSRNNGSEANTMQANIYRDVKALFTPLSHNGMIVRLAHEISEYRLTSIQYVIQSCGPCTLYEPVAGSNVHAVNVS